MIRLRGNDRVTYRPSTQADLIEFFGVRPKESVKALSFFLDGNLSAIAGFKIERGNFVIFSDIKENVTVEKTTIWRCAKVVMDMIKAENIPMYAVSEKEKFVKFLGFSHIDKEVYQWHS